MEDVCFCRMINCWEAGMHWSVCACARARPPARPCVCVCERVCAGACVGALVAPCSTAEVGARSQPLSPLILTHFFPPQLHSASLIADQHTNAICSTGASRHGDGGRLFSFMAALTNIGLGVMGPELRPQAERGALKQGEGMPRSLGFRQAPLPPYHG